MKNNLPLSYIEIYKNNLIYNIKQFKKFTKKDTQFSVAIKGNAYGHGQNEVAKIIEPYVDYFFINSMEELELLRKVSKKKVFLLGYVQKLDLSKAIKLSCILSVFSVQQLKELNNKAQILKVKQEIHIPFDAYLGREGFLLKDLPKFLEEARKCKFIKITGIYAHFANIEDTDDFSHAQKQINEYEKALELMKSFSYKNLQTHISATSGVLVYEKNIGVNPIVRLGIGVYGMWPSEYLQNKYKNSGLNLKPVFTWRTKIAQIKLLPEGNTVGYGLTYRTERETKIAIIPQGYADGLDRGLSNKGEVLIGGTRCKIIGRISMNMFAVDISHLEKVESEDEVIILGRQNREEITAEEIALKINTINYEVTTRVSSILPRVIA